MPDSAENAISLLYVATAICFASIGVPQTVSLVSRWRSGDGLQLFRLLWALLSGAMCIGTTYRALVWVDLSVFDQAVMGPIATRWPIEVSIAWLVFAASVFSAFLYWRTRSEDRP